MFVTVPSGQVVFDHVTPVRSAPVKSAPVKFASVKFALFMIVLSKYALLKLTPVKFNPFGRISPIRFVPGPNRKPPISFHSDGNFGTPLTPGIGPEETLVKFDPVKSAPSRFVRHRSTPVRSKLVRSKLVRSKLVRSAPVRSAPGPTRYPRISFHPEGNLEEPVMPPKRHHASWLRTDLLRLGQHHAASRYSDRRSSDLLSSSSHPSKHPIAFPRCEGLL